MWNINPFFWIDNCGKLGVPLIFARGIYPCLYWCAINGYNFLLFLYLHICVWWDKYIFIVKIETIRLRLSKFDSRVYWATRISSRIFVYDLIWSCRIWPLFFCLRHSCFVFVTLSHLSMLIQMYLMSHTEIFRFKDAQHTYQIANLI